VPCNLGFEVRACLPASLASACEIPEGFLSQILGFCRVSGHQYASEENQPGGPKQKRQVIRRTTSAPASFASVCEVVLTLSAVNKIANTANHVFLMPFPVSPWKTGWSRKLQNPGGTSHLPLSTIGS
jgi:hypothetical protein